MDFLRAWFLGVAGAAMAGVFALAVTPQGAVKKVTQIAAALLLVIAVLRPFVGLEGLTVPDEWPVWGVEDGLLNDSAAELLSSIIAGKTAAYIENKAQAVGLAVSVTARCRAGDPYPEPWSVTVRSERPEHAKSALAKLIEQALGIPPERQEYTETRHTLDEKGGNP